MQGKRVVSLLYLASSNEFLRVFPYKNNKTKKKRTEHPADGVHVPIAGRQGERAAVGGCDPGAAALLTV